jgi:hypothetical protein
MRKYEANQNGPILVVNFGNESVLVPADVKDRTFLIWISMRERPSRFRKIPPDGSLSHAIPRIERFFGVRVSLPELFQSLSANDVQGEPLIRRSLTQCCQNGNRKSS